MPHSKITEYSPTGSPLGLFATSINGPEGLAFDSSINLYVANYGGNPISEFSPSGASLGTFASAGLGSPTGLAFDTTGDLFVSNYVGTIVEFSPTGSSLETFATMPGHTTYIPFVPAVPEPSSLVMAGAPALVGLTCVRRRGGGVLRGRIRSG
jgi:DNA-binding beta-propeller fold protein YncE